MATQLPEVPTVPAAFDSVNTVAPNGEEELASKFTSMMIGTARFALPVFRARGGVRRDQGERMDLVRRRRSIKEVRDGVTASFAGEKQVFVGS